MDVNDNAGVLIPRSVRTTIASKLAPTVVRIPPVGASLLAMVANDDAGHLTPCGAWATIASMLAPTASVLAMVVNDNAGVLLPRGVRATIASKLAPTVARIPPVGASLLAMVANDDAGHLTPCGAWATIASMLAPTASLLAMGSTQPSGRRINTASGGKFSTRDKACPWLGSSSVDAPPPLP